MAGVRHSLSRVVRLPRSRRPEDAVAKLESADPPCRVGFDSSGRCAVVYSRVMGRRVEPETGDTYCLVSWLPKGL